MSVPTGSGRARALVLALALSASLYSQDPVLPPIETPPPPAVTQQPQTPEQREAFERARDQAIDDVETIVITATRTPRPIMTAPASVYRRTGDQINLEDFSRTLVDSLRYLPGTSIQKTSYGQSSPFLRGLTGYHTLLMMDGIRLNDSILRSGPNDLWSSVDVESVDAYELVLGPSSVLYGSDAIGGTLNVLPFSRHDYTKPCGFNSTTRARFASAENAITWRQEFEGNVGNRFGYAMGVTTVESDDLRAGGDVGDQPHTGYGFDAMDGVFDFRLSDKWKLRLIGQGVSLDDVRRTHQTIYGVSYHGTTIGTDRRRTLDYERELAGATLDGENLGGWVDRARFQVSYQHYGERQDRIRGSGARTKDGIDVHTLGLVANASSKTAIGYLTYGVDYYHDRVDSFRNEFNAAGVHTSSGVQGPVGDDGSYDLLGVYVQDEVRIAPCWSLIAGARFTYAAIDVDHVANPPVGGEISIDDDWANVVASAKVLYRPRENLTFFGGVSQGYRTPNFSDLTRLDSARTNELEVPTPGLDPESSVNFEVGGRLDGRFSIEGSYYYTILDDFIVRRPTGALGPNNEAIVIKDNAGDGHIQGIDVAASYQFNCNWSVRATGTWQDGQIEGFPTSAPDSVTEPVSRLAPLTGTMIVRWNTSDQRFWIEGRALCAAQQDRLTSGDKADTQRIPPGGTPGYTVFGIHGGARLNDHVTIFGGIDNITDKNYRVHGSGVQEPGLNAILGVEVRF